MSDSKKPQDDWIEVGQRRAQQHAHAPSPGSEQPDTEKPVLGKARTTPPGKVSLRVGITAFLLMLAIYIFADLRDIQVPWQRQFRIGYLLMFIPIFGFVWGLIALVKREAGDARRAVVGIVLSIAAFGLGLAIIAARTQKIEAESEAAANDRVRLAPQDLGKWREEKLHREQ